MYNKIEAQYKIHYIPLLRIIWNMIFFFYTFYYLKICLFHAIFNIPIRVKILYPQFILQKELCRFIILNIGRVGVPMDVAGLIHTSSVSTTFAKSTGLWVEAIAFLFLFFLELDTLVNVTRLL